MIVSLTLIIAIFTIAITCAYFYIKRTYTYWQRKGFPYIEPRIPFGNLNDKEQFHQQIDQLYKSLKGKGQFAGIYLFHQPYGLVLNLDLIKQILVKDFPAFSDRGMYYNEKDDPLSAHLVSLNGEKWKNLRNKLSPTFSSGKMKFMFSTIMEVANQFDGCVAELIKETPEIEMKELLAKFTTDIIGTCAFGIECNSLTDSNAEFRRMGKKAIEKPRYSTLVQFLMNSNPNLARRFHMKLIADDVSEFFMKIVRETVELREANNVKRNDFMDILIELKNESKGSLTLNEIAAQVFLFFQAGFETSATTMTFALYELATHPDVQEKLRRDIKLVMERHQNCFSYEAMMDMQYLDQVINETLRLHPPIASLMRELTTDYKIPDSENTSVLSKGTKIIIPIYSIQHDEEYFTNPNDFIPERFASDKVAKRHAMTFLSFGDGPRNCIGQRFGMQQIRIGLVTMLLNYEFSKCTKTPDTLTYAKDNFMLTPDGEMWLTVRKVIDEMPAVATSSIPILINRSTYKKYEYFEI